MTEPHGLHVWLVGDDAIVADATGHEVLVPAAPRGWTRSLGDWAIAYLTHADAKCCTRPARRTPCAPNTSTSGTASLATIIANANANTAARIRATLAS